MKSRQRAQGSNSSQDSDNVKVIDEVRSQLGDELALVPGQDPRPLSVLHVGKFYPPHRRGVETHLQHLVSHQSAHMSVEVIVANNRAVTETQVLDGARVRVWPPMGPSLRSLFCPSLPWRLTGHSESIIHLHVPNPWADGPLIS